jgi:hypothetical protein
MIKKRQNEILTRLSELMPDEISTMLVQLSAIYPNLEVELAEKEVIYCKKKEEIFNTGQLVVNEKDKSMSWARAENLAKTTEEYKEYRIVVGWEKSLIEMIRALKKRLAVLSNEWEASSNL